ncbi:hypothetical protein Chor_009527 [Crotalus horridus]
MPADPIPTSTLQGGSDKEHLYSTVCKPLSPKTKEAAPPPFSSSSGVLGAGLCELDRLLQELNATQFNITDEIMSQFPSSKSPAADKDKERLDDSTDGTSLSRSTVSPSVKPTATSATLELDKLMASLSDFRVQSNMSPGQPSGNLDSMLVMLESDLSRQGISTTAKGLCASCQKPIAGQVVTALGSTWHPEHFVCTYCQKEMGGSNFFEKDGAPYCERDYFQLFSPRCGFCNEPILDVRGFHEKDGKQYCRQDFYELFSTRCQGCSQAILENYISALNAFFFEHSGRPFCEIHYHKQRGSLCSGCEKPITGRCITAMGRKFHPEHFVCAFCLKQLNKGTFKEQNEKPYCHPCFIKLFG